MTTTHKVTLVKGETFISYSELRANEFEAPVAIQVQQFRGYDIERSTEMSVAAARNDYRQRVSSGFVNAAGNTTYTRV